MAFLDDLTTTLSEAMDTTVKCASKLAGQAKLKYQIATLKRELEKDFALIGQMSYEAYQNKIDNSEKSEKIYAKIEEQLQAIRTLEAKLAKADDCKLCPVCGEKLSKETIYCHKCGTKQDTTE